MCRNTQFIGAIIAQIFTRVERAITRLIEIHRKHVIYQIKKKDKYEMKSGLIDRIGAKLSRIRNSPVAFMREIPFHHVPLGKMPLSPFPLQFPLKQSTAEAKLAKSRAHGCNSLIIARRLIVGQWKISQ